MSDPHRYNAHISEGEKLAAETHLRAALHSVALVEAGASTDPVVAAIRSAMKVLNMRIDQ